MFSVDHPYGSLLTMAVTGNGTEQTTADSALATDLSSNDFEDEILKAVIEQDRQPTAQAQLSSPKTSPSNRPKRKRKIFYNDSGYINSVSLSDSDDFEQRNNKTECSIELSPTTQRRPNTNIGNTIDVEDPANRRPRINSSRKKSKTTTQQQQQQQHPPSYGGSGIIDMTTPTADPPKYLRQLPNSVASVIQSVLTSANPISLVEANQRKELELLAAKLERSYNSSKSSDHSSMQELQQDNQRLILEVKKLSEQQAKSRQLDQQLCKECHLREVIQQELRATKERVKTLALEKELLQTHVREYLLKNNIES